MMRLVNASSSFVLAASLIGVIGCGDDAYPKADVTGKVTCSGVPAHGGVITFEPIDAPDKTGRKKGNPGRPSRGTVQEDGSFELTYEPGGGDSASAGAVIGPHRVTFILPQSTPWQFNKADEWLPEDEKVKIKAELAKRPVYKELDCGPAVTPAEIEVKAGSNSFEFQLQPGKPAKPIKQAGSD